MNARKSMIALLALGACLASVAQASAAASRPAWRLDVIPMPTNFAPGAHNPGHGGPTYLVVATNVGGETTSGPITFTDTLPPELAVSKTREIGARNTDHLGRGAEISCTAPVQTVTCTTAGSVQPGYSLQFRILIDVETATPQSVQNEASIEGGGAAATSVATSTQISAQPAPFDFLAGPAGLSAPLLEADGNPASGGGSHPYGLSVNLGFPTEAPEGFLIGAGHLHDASSDLPPGLIVNPTATPVLCTEDELITETSPGCPEESQIGTATVITVGAGTEEAVTTPLYNMVAPPGVASNFGFDGAGVGVFAHVFGSVRSDGDYGLTGGTADILSLPGNPVFGARLDLWGDPSDESHGGMRGRCRFANQVESCPIEAQQIPALTAPGHCSGTPATTTATASSWEEPDAKHASYESADLNGNPVSISGCNQLDFEPTIDVTPTTNLTDSPAGLDVTLHQPPEAPGPDPLEGRTPATLRDASVTLPAGMAANPSQADGLAACSEEQIGYQPSGGEIHFSKDPAACPEAAKIGSLEVTTPLLAETDESGTKIAHDPETGAVIPRPLHGSVFLAEPIDNPFGSLLAIYLALEDPRSGTVAKLAGRVIPDPQTGQLTTVFEENPQLPLQDVKLHLFGGARGSLITPPTCGVINARGEEEPHTTTTDLTPWSAPETPDAHPASGFSLSSAPAGPCAKTPAQLPNAPSFTAGTVSPQAGAFSPFGLKLSREDGSQRLTGFDTLLPPGLTGKLAGIPACSESALAQAASRSGLDEGITERTSPSCPAASALGTVTVAAGAGPTPFHTNATAYLAGPYKGAPLSMAVITPAIAGPFDLGTVLVRAALYVNPDTAQIHAVSDPFPTILHGIPLDLRSVAVKLDRPSFILNPTSCDPMAITGSATSALGATSPLSSPFQIGGCPDLPFKPKLSLELKGKTKRTSHPKLIANLVAKPGEANIAAAQVKLPKAAFLDNAHIGTICTKVQFAAKACPPASIYGTVSATTPLLDYTLTGNVYLRSSSHQLPDLVADLNGPSSQPIEIALAGTTDSIKGALRNTFEAVPDQPVTKFHLKLFGGKRGLIILSSGLCKSPRATVDLDGQNGKVYDTEPVVKTSCPKKHKKKGGGGKHRHRSGRGGH